MPESKGNSCQAHRERLVELVMEAKTEPLESQLADHLAACSACRSYWEAARGLRPAFALPDLYTAGLRYRTLKRLASEAESPDKSVLGLVIPVSFMSLLVWFAIPLLFLTELLDYWLSRPWLALGLAGLLLTSVGFLVGCLAFVALTGGRRSQHRPMGRIKDLLEGFYA